MADPKENEEQNSEGSIFDTDSMEDLTPTPVPSKSRAKAAAGRSGRRSRKARSGNILLLTVVFIIIIAFIVFGPDKLVFSLYNETAALILGIMIVEYLVLKSQDRTRVYKIENQRLRDRRRVESSLLRRAKALLDERMESPDFEDEEASVRWNVRAEDLSREIEKRS
ncbi:hypothetical protein KQI84_06135 [bacterium]|nr:hypothetical protein [bacterium]